MDAGEELRASGAEIPKHTLDTGDEHEPVGAQLHGKQRRSEVLVDYRLDAPEFPVPRSAPVIIRFDYRDATTAGGDGRDAKIQHTGDDLGLYNTQRLRRGHDAPPAACLIVDEGHASRGERCGLLGVEPGSDRFTRSVEGRVLRVYDHLGEHGGHGTMPATDVVQGLLQQVAHLAFGLGHTDFQGQAVGFAERFLHPGENNADLGRVAVGKKELRVTVEERRERRQGALGEGKLTGDAQRLTGTGEGIAAEADDQALCHVDTSWEVVPLRESSANRGAGCLPSRPMHRYLARGADLPLESAHVGHARLVPETRHRR